MEESPQLPKVLYIGSGSPWAGGAGYLVRQNLLLRALAEVANLHLAMFDSNTEQPPPFPCRFTALPMPQRANSGALKRLGYDLFSSTPRMFRGYDLEKTRQAVAEIHPDQFDAVFSFRIDFGHFAGILDHPRLILDIDDPEHLRWKRRIQAITSEPPDWRTQRDLEKLRAFEHAAAAQARLAFVCQANDAVGWPKAPMVIPNCVDLLEHPRRDAAAPRILFVGNTAGGEQNPNVDAVRFFLKDIWPQILKAVPNAVFQIVGAARDSIRQAAATSGNVELLGFVSSLDDIYAQASLSVAPIRFGTGTRIKILEAFAHACPVVSTVAGADGIEAARGDEIELAANAAEFSARCIHLLQLPADGERLGQAGYALAQRLYDRKEQHGRLVKILREFLEESK